MVSRFREEIVTLFHDQPSWTAFVHQTRTKSKRANLDDSHAWRLKMDLNQRPHD